MKLLIIDPRRGKSSADLFILEAGSSEMKKMPLGYVPELHYDAVRHQIVIVETQIRKNSSEQTRHWLKCLSADNLDLRLQKETPERPMFSGYPGRSTRVKSSRSGRFLYFLESRIHPTAIQIYRLLVHRYDYEKDEIQTGRIKIDSCLIDFDQIGENEDELCFHLSCEYPSVVAFGNFTSAKLEMLNLEELSPRTHGPKETCGSWFSKRKNRLYCVNGEGAVYEVNLSAKTSKLLSRLLLKPGSLIPLQQIYEAGESLLIGVSADVGERGLSMASEIWQISTASGELLDKIKLPFPVMNFIVTPDNQLILGVSPYQKAVAFVELSSGKTLGVRDEIGISPAEIIFIP